MAQTSRNGYISGYNATVGLPLWRHATRHPSLTASRYTLYHTDMARGTSRRAIVAAFTAWAATVSTISSGWTEDLPLTRNLPLTEFQNRAEDARPYDFDAPPEGFFRSIVTAEDFEEEIGPLRSHVIVPVKP